MTNASRSSSSDAMKTAAVVNALPIVAYMADGNGQIVYVSHGWERLTGNSAAGISKGGYEAVIHPDDRAAVVAAWQAACAAGTSYRDEFRMRFGDGSYRWVLSQADPMRDENGAVAAWCGTISDVHEQRLVHETATDELRAAGERLSVLERLLEAGDDCVIVLTIDGRIVSMSDKSRGVFGIGDSSQVRGSEWLALWPEQDRDTARDAVERARTGGRGRFTGLLAVGGREQWWDVVVTAVLAEDGRPELLLAVSRNVTETVVAQRELARSEERYRLLAESIPGTAWTATPDGRLDHISEGPTPSIRRPIASRLGHGWLQGIHPDEREATGALWRHSIEPGEPYEAQFRVLMADGTYRWKLARATPQRDEAGSIVRWIGVNVDIDEQRRAHDEREMFVALAQNSSDIIGFTDPEGNVVYVNPAARDLLSLDDPRSIHFLVCFSPQDLEFVKSFVVPAMEREGRWVGEFRMRNFRTGTALPILYNAFVLTDGTGRKLGLATISRDLRERRRIDLGMRALADAAAVMYGSLDYEETLRNIAEAVMKTYATCCTIDVLDEDGAFRRVAIAHPGADMRLTFEGYADQSRFQPGHPVYDAIRFGASTYVSRLDPDWMARQIPSLAEASKTLRIRSFISAPVRAPDGSVLGALTCSLDLDDPRPSYVAADVPFVEELGRRAGIAVQHARAYGRERAIAMRFQEASLPGILPTVEHVSLSADYRPGNSEATIGGDWYDAFTLPDGRLVITLGDVVGKGLDAAVTMAKVRQAMRSAAALVPEPAAMLTAAGSTLHDVAGENYATALAGIYDPAGYRFSFATAGHPGPTVRGADGSVRDHTARGIMFGLRSGSTRETVAIALEPGSTAVFFTDGLTESTRNIDEGYRRLHAAILHTAAAATGNPARAIVDDVLRGEPALDDIAVLVMQIA